jgi:hypothetical protein
LAALGCLSLLRVFPEQAHVGFRNNKFREATIQTDQKLWKYDHGGLVQALEAREMYGEFPVESTLVLRLARLARHITLRTPK